jgi:hypothetical protein
MNPNKGSTASARRKPGGKSVQSIVITDALTPAVDERHDWIARTAYHKAAARGFAPGREMDDWLEAEAEFAAQRGH